MPLSPCIRVSMNQFTHSPSPRVMISPLAGFRKINAQRSDPHLHFNPWREHTSDRPSDPPTHPSRTRHAIGPTCQPNNGGLCHPRLSLSYPSFTLSPICSRCLTLSCSLSISCSSPPPHSPHSQNTPLAPPLGGSTDTAGRCKHPHPPQSPPAASSSLQAKVVDQVHISLLRYAPQ